MTTVYCFMAVADSCFGFWRGRGVGAGWCGVGGSRPVLMGFDFRPGSFTRGRDLSVRLEERTRVRQTLFFSLLSRACLAVLKSTAWPSK